MNLYPAMKASMGRWNYFVVKMTMREIAESVKFAADVYDDRTLDEAIQRVLNESRVKRDIVTYLVRQPDRFFSSIVVAALEGNPKWYPVSIEDDDRFALFRGDARLNETFGVLSFDGTQDYYALDGQHRLAAIKALVDRNSDAAADAPAGFSHEEVSVIVVVPESAESHDEFMKRYRRLFGNLNRYAKPMDQVTNIIMDEDDSFAIITRRLITEHEFFRAPGKQKESLRVKTTKGKNLKSSDSFFTSLETLYEMNIRLLMTANRRDAGWDNEGNDDTAFRRFRPDEEVIDRLFEELLLYWNGLLNELEILRQNPSTMRNHGAFGDDSDQQDCVLFWPIGQELLADVARTMLNLRQRDSRAPTSSSVTEALKGLAGIDWRFHAPPWRHLLLIPDSDGSSSWRIRSEERKPAQDVAKRIVKWQLGLDELASHEVQGLREDWQEMLLPAMEAPKIDELWQEIEERVLR